VLGGKLVFYEKGFIFIDNKLNAIVLSYDDIEFINFYLADEVWMEVKVKQTNSLPTNLIATDILYFKVN
jgi:hypothetical protein